MGTRLQGETVSAVALHGSQDLSVSDKWKGVLSQSFVVKFVETNRLADNKGLWSTAQGPIVQQNTAGVY